MFDLVSWCKTGGYLQHCYSASSKSASGAVHWELQRSAQLLHDVLSNSFCVACTGACLKHTLIFPRIVQNWYERQQQSRLGALDCNQKNPRDLTR
jgi:hypothetical protein